MKLRHLILAVAAVAAGASSLVATSAFAQAKEQFFPLLSYRTGPYAPNGTPWANGKQDYIKLVNARDGGINGVKLTF
ncbi:ABC transporter substrate-binding protein, partial [Rhizobium sp. BUS002]